MEGIDINQGEWQELTHADNGKQKKTVSENFLKKDFALFGKRLSDKKKERFYAKLHVLLAAGMDIKRGLELIERTLQLKSDKELIHTLHQKIVGGGKEKGGTPLSQAMKESKKFSPYEYISVFIGEESGKLVAVLKELAAFYQNKIKLQRQVMNIASYPALVLILTIGVTFFMIRFVIPMLANSLKRLGKELPPLTKFVIDSSELIATYFPFALILLVVLIVLAVSQKEKRWYRKLNSNIILSIPIVGNIYRKIYLGRFCNAMALLINAKVDTYRALDLVQKMIRFYPIENSLESIRQAFLQDGTPIHKSMARFSIYDEEMTALLEVGDEVNKLDEMFSDLSRQYRDDIEHQANLLNNQMQVILLVLIGAIGGIIVVAMYLPMFEYSTGLR